MYEKLINDRYWRLKEWRNQEGLNDLLAESYKSLFEYNKKCFEELAASVAAEERDSSFRDGPPVSVAVCEAAALDRQRVLFPVCPAAPDPQTGTLAYVFMEEGYGSINEKLAGEYTAAITLKTKAEPVRVKARLQPSAGHLAKMKGLYETFMANEQAWTTLNAAYFYKCLDLYTEEKLDIKSEDVLGVEVTPGLGAGASLDKRIVWSAEEMTVKSPWAAVPAGNAVQYEHTLKLPAGNCRYMVKPAGRRFSAFWRDKRMIVRTYAEDPPGEMTVVRLHDAEPNPEGLCLPPKSSAKEETFSGLLARSNGLFLPTRGEAERILRSLGEGLGLELTDMRVLPGYKNAGACELPDFNFFIHASSFPAGRRVMLFTFKKTGAGGIWDREAAAYAVSELQRHFRDYKCAGKLEPV